MNKKNWIIGFLLLLALVGFIQRDFLMEQIQPVLNARPQQEVLRVVLSNPTDSLSADRTDLGTVTRTANIYEALVAFDRNLKIVPALALSWGNLTPTLWEFKLRREVVFHDGTPFTAKSVVERYAQAQAAQEPELTPYLKTIQEIREMDPFTIQIETTAPDPLLLSKLTKLFIAREGNVGTGPYRVREWTPKGILSLATFPDYWGELPVFKNVTVDVVTNRTQRKLDFENGKIDILAAVPRDQALELPQEQLRKSYGLEVNFLMFNLTDPLLSDRKIREALQTLIDPATIEAIGNHFVRPATQLVAPGVFGFNPAIPAFTFDETKMAKDFFGKQVKKINLDFLETYRTLGEYLKKQLRTAGFSVQANELLGDELLTRIRENKTQLFLIGWQAEDGDAGGFLDTFIHSQGEFNGGRYKNPEVDALIEQSRQEMIPEKRLMLLQDILLKVNEDLIGIPLFESSRLYAVKPGIEWEPRTDGLVLAAEVK